MSQKPGKFEFLGDIGRHYGKFDLDRIGIFDDRPAGPFDKYAKAKPTSRSDFKGRQILSGPSDGLFEKTFKRIFHGEALATVPRSKKKVDVLIGRRAMLPPSPTKLHSTPNDWYGCIGKTPDYFSPAVKKTKKKQGGESPNCKIKPNPLGGPGYADICLNPYPKHPSEPYDIQGGHRKGRKVKEPPAKNKFLTSSAPLDYFPPNPYVELKSGPTYVRPAKKASSKIIGTGRFYVPFPKRPGGQHAGGFNKFPEHKDDPYRDRKTDIQLAAPGGPKFLGGGPKSRSKYTNSIVDQVTEISCNVQNYRGYRERVYPLSIE